MKTAATASDLRDVRSHCRAAFIVPKLPARLIREHTLTLTFYTCARRDQKQIPVFSGRAPKAIKLAT